MPSFMRCCSGALIVRRLLLGTAVFLFCLAGIITRPHLDLAALWPANAFMLGMFLRFPRLASPLSWISCASGYLLADALTGADALTNIVLNGANLLSVATGYWVLTQRPNTSRSLHDPESMLYFLWAIIAASFAAGLAGIAIHPLIFGGGWTEGFFFWSTTELVNYIALLPMVLTMPAIGWPKRDSRKKKALFRTGWSKIMPALTLIVSVVAGAIVGGPGAIAFPVPALLWCALIYGVFTTAV